ncbi:MAG TPA: SPOR domain-containing protein [Methylophilaceae bacterium]|jgi:DedD protein
MATEQLTDQEKDFRRRARRRLIGAVALVLLMVTVLPMLLDDRSDQNMPAADVAISIPSQDDSGFTSKIVPTSPAVAPAPVVEPSTPVPSAPVAAPVTPAQPAKAVEKSPAQSSVPPPMVQMDPPLAPAAKEPAQKEDKASDKEDKPVAEKATVEKAVPKKGMVSVQIGVFSDSAKVKQVQAKVAALGLKSGFETLNTPTGPKLRMRSGPYATKAEAEQALETLKGAGFSPILVMH